MMRGDGVGKVGGFKTGGCGRWLVIRSLENVD